MEQNINDANQNSNNSGITSNSLFELIQNIQNKLNVEQNQNTDKEVSKENPSQPNDNIYEKSAKNIDTNSGFDFSSLGDILSKFASGGGNSSNDASQDNSSNDMNFDMNTMLRMQKVLGQMNRKDPRKSLLLSLKPFLRKSRQDRISEYITILNVTSALGIFGDKGSD